MPDIGMVLLADGDPSDATRLHSRLAAYRERAAWAVLGMGTVVLTGWALGIRSLQSFVPGWVTMKANTALGLTAAAAALILFSISPAHTKASRPTWVARLLAWFVVAVGLLTAAQYALGVDLGIDQLFFSARADAGTTATPGRMAAITAITFALLGLALATTRISTMVSRLIVHPAGLAAVAIALASLLGHLYGAIPVVGAGQGLQIAAHTALGVLLLATGTLTLEAHVGWLPALLSRRPGGILARRLLPVAIGVPLSLGALRLTGEWFHVGGPTTGSAVVAVITMFAFGIVIWQTAYALNVADAQWRSTNRERVQLALREAEARARADTEGAARALAERAAREKDEALRLLDIVLDSTPVAFALLDLQLRYQRVNPAMAAFNGLPREAHAGRALREIVPEVADQLEATYRQVLATGQPIISAERTGTTAAFPGKRRHWLSSTYPVKSPAGDILALGVMVVETTERRELEAQLQQAQKMEAVGQLAGGVAHDFNNVLTAIKSFAELVALDLPHDSTSRADVAEITAAADRAASLTRQLLAFSRRQLLQPVVLDPNAVVEGITKLLGRLIGPEIRCEPVLAPDVGRILADQGQLEQVLVNLAVNARDAMPDGGSLVIETANVTVDDSHAVRLGGGEDAAPGDYVMIAVSDSGIGMDAATQARIFEPFFTTKEPGKGTGLGLSTVYGIVRQSAGYLGVYSEVGRGTTFRVYLPRAEGALRAVEARPAAPVRAAATETILVVDDDPAVRAVTSRILTRAGYHVLSAGSGAEAESIWRGHERGIHLLMTDLMMPDINGSDLARRFLEAQPGGRVLYTSGYTSENVVRRGLIVAEASFLAKPFTLDDAVRKVREALGER